jgi:ribonuclease T2
MVKSIFRAVLAALVLAVAAPASAQDQRQNEPGQFDFYVLALSWSPSFCEAAAERGGSRNASSQCGARPYSFVVHGCGRNTQRVFLSIARSRRRDSIAASSPRCST